MAFSTNNNKKVISEINVTPLVDVMLVLLVIFMITAPLMLNGINLDLPKTKEVNPISLTNEQVILSFTRADEYFIGKDKFLKNELIGQIKNKFQDNKSSVLFLRADYGMKYGKVAKLMSYLKHNGINQIALVTETEN